jgi:hypothetical protein
MHEGAQNFLHPRFVLRAISVTLTVAQASVFTLHQPHAGIFQGNVFSYQLLERKFTNLPKAFFSLLCINLGRV